MIVSKVFRPLILYALLANPLFSCPLKAQEKDAGLWTSFNFEVKVVKKLTANLTQEFRFNENISELGMSYTDAGLEYKINKHFQVAANYRFSQKRRVDDYYSFRHRYYVTVKYSRKIKPFELVYRFECLEEYADLGRASDGGTMEYYLRNKLSLKWDTKKPYTPYISIEFFSPMNYPRTAAFDNIRPSAGMEYDFSKHHKIELYYMINKEVNVNDPLTSYIIGFGYYYKL